MPDVALEPSPTFEIGFDAPSPVRTALAGIGRAEDLKFSPDGARLAIAGADRGRILVLEIEAGFEAQRARVAATGFLELVSPAFKYPHGLCWLDERTIAVANRGAELAIVALPDDPLPPSRRCELAPLRTLGIAEFAVTPGSVAARSVGLGLVELLVGNDQVDSIARHLLDRRDGWAPLASELALERGLAGPDGVAYSASGHWVAISNHHRNEILIFRNDPGFGRESAPHAILSGVACPHGLCFAADDRRLLVADAGAPFMHVFRRGDGGWSADSALEAGIQVYDRASFRRGHYAEAEGGPKGVDLRRDGRLMAVCCERTPLAFFDLRRHLPADMPEARPGRAPEAEEARAALIRALTVKRLDAHEAVAAISLACQHQRRSITASRSWRYTAPLRRLAHAVRRATPWRQS
jgi:hypothetical protein